MKTKYLLFLKKGLETTISEYLIECFQTSEPIILKQFFFAVSDMKLAKEAAIVITQKTLAKELAEIGPLQESIQNLKRAGIIIIPDKPFMSIDRESGGRQVTITNKDVAEQFKKSVDIILDESTPRHAILFI